MFPTVFFPATMPAFVALIASFSTFAVGFIARPFGGVVFGHLGDKVGRKKALVAALILMGLATTLIAFLPSYSTAGAFSPLALLMLRLAQGLAVGGQWGGATLLATESAPSSRRGAYGAIAQAGVFIGVLLANLAGLGGRRSHDAARLHELWLARPISVQRRSDWRRPFRAFPIAETEAFRQLQRAGDPRRRQGAPLVIALRTCPGRLVLAAASSCHCMRSSTLSSRTPSPTAPAQRDSICRVRRY